MNDFLELGYESDTLFFFFFFLFFFFFYVRYWMLKAYGWATKTFLKIYLYRYALVLARGNSVLEYGRFGCLVRLCVCVCYVRI